MVIRIAAWSVIGHPTNAKFDVAKLKSIWRFSVGMSGISLSALAFTQLDKVILSKMLELEAFGQYMLATVVVSGLYVLISPVFNIIYPRFSAMVASGERDKLVRWYRLGTRGFATLLFSITLTLIVFSEELIRVWTQNPLLASKAAPLTSLLVLGSALNGVMFFPYALQLSYGLTWIPLAINGTLMCFLVPMVFFLAQKYGALGGAIAWLTVETVYVLLGPWLTHRYLLKGLAFKWQFVDVGLPLVVVAFVGVVGFYLFKDTAYSDYVKLVAGGGMSLIAVLLMLVVSKELREVVFTYARNNKN